MKTRLPAKKKTPGVQTMLRSKMDFMDKAMDASPVSIVVTDQRGKITYANRQAEKILGLTKNEIMQRTYNDPSWHITDIEGKPISPEELPFTQVMKIGKPVNNIQHAIEQPRGNRIYVSVNATPLFDDAKNICGMVATIEDITARVKAEKQLEEKTKELERYFSSSLDLLCIADVDGYFRRLNPEWQKVLGYTLAELENQKFLDFVHPDDRESTREAVSLLSRQKEVLNFTNRYRSKDGSYRWIEWRSFPKDKMIYATARDITERKLAEEALKESEERLHRLSDITVDGIAIHEKGLILDANETLAKMFGYELFEIINQPAAQYFTPESAKILMQNIVGGFENPYEVTGVKKDGSIFPVEILAKETKYRNRRARITSVRDITERKRAEEARSAAEEQYRHIFDNMSIGIFQTTPRGKFIKVNPALASMYGFISPDEMMRSVDNIGEQLYVNSSDRETYTRLLAQGDASVDFVCENFRKDRTRIWVQISAHRKKNKIGEIECYEGYITDITKRKEAEEALKASEEKYRAIIETTSEWIWEINLQGRHTFSNKGVESVLGYPVSEFLESNTFNFIVEEDRIKVQNKLNEMIKSKQGWRNWIIRWHHKNGSIRFLESNANPILDSEGKLLGFRGSDRDITKHIEAEGSLRRSEEKFRSLAENTSDWIWEVNLEGKYIYSNPKVYHILGYKPDEIIGKSPFEFMNADEAKRIQGLFHDAIISRKEFSGLINHNVHKDGHEIILESSGTPVFDAQNNLIGYRGIDRNITERQRAEKELEEIKAMMTASFMQTPVPMVLVSMPDYIVRLVNQACLEFLGIQDEPPKIGESFATLKQTWEDFDEQGNHVPLSEMPLALALQGIETKNKKCYVRRKDGTIRWEEASASSVRNAAGDIIAAYLVFPDITERKQAEDSLRESEELIRAIIDHAPFGAHSYELQDDGRLIFRGGNQSADRILSLNHSALVGKSIEEAFPGLVGTTVPEMYRRVASTGEIREVDQVEYDGGKVTGAFEIHAFQTAQNRMTVFFRDITERKQAEEALRESEERFRTTLYSIGDGVITTDTKGKVQQMNHIAEVLTGWSEREACGKNIEEIFQIINEETNAPAENPVIAVLEKGVVVGLANHTTLVAHDGSRRPIADSGAPIHNHRGDITGVVLVFNDQTERKELQNQLLQAQKMDAIGRLAGGVAHDFNNMIGVILGYAMLIEKQLDSSNPLTQKVKAIITAAERSAKLTAQLLSFARKQIANPIVLNLNDEISILQKMLHRLIGEDIDLRILPGNDLWNTKIDPVQIDQILTNLASNARDAIHDVGTISIETSNISFDASFSEQYPELVPGEYVVLKFSDTGKGMDRATREHMFEPFFTTKPKGQGTGLGLATVFGIVKQNNGYIHVYSELEKGTTINIYFPRHYGEAETPLTIQEEIALTGTETILIVEDEEQLLNLAITSLKTYGYTVLGAKTPREALAICQNKEQ